MENIVTLKTWHKVALAIGLASVLVASAAVVLVVWRIKTSGRIIAIGCKVYKDANQTETLKEINWGLINESESKSYICYIKNVKTERITLDISTNNYQPPEAEYVLQTVWNITSTHILEPQETVTTIITLTVSEDALGITNFYYDIVIRATRQP